MKKIQKKHVLNLLKLAIGLAIIFVLLNKFNLTKIIEILKSIPLIYTITTLLLYVAINLVTTIKTSLLISPFNKKAPFWKLFKDCSLSWALGLFIPGKIGELSLIYLLKEYKLNIGPSTAIVLLDKIFGLITLSAVSLLGFSMFLTSIDAIRLIVVLIILYSAILFFVFSDYGRNLIKRFILRDKSKKFKGFSKSLFFLIRENKSISFYVFLLGFMRWVINAFILYILLIYFKQPAGYMQVLSLSSIVTTISFIPITYNGLGLRESSAIALFNLIGVNEIVILSLFLYSLIVAYLLGVFHLLISIKRIKEIK